MILIGDIWWMLFAAVIQQYVVGEKVTQKEGARGKKVAVFVSWFFFLNGRRTAAISDVTVVDALITGAIFGGLSLAVIMLIQLSMISRAKRKNPAADAD